ncbi:MAG: hypothetical protein AAGA66_03525 [Bacteroidota bacterium]
MKPLHRFSHLFFKIIALILMVMLTACEKALVEPYENFILPAGKHSGSFPFQSLQSTSLKFKAVFNESAIYQTGLKENQHDINKLMGFSDCNAHHHENSARFGWRWLDGQLEIHAYTYTNGERNTEFVGNVELDRAYEYHIELNENSYDFYLQDVGTITMRRSKFCSTGLYYMLYPYFGGNEKAPHDITIQVRMVY